VIDWGGAGRSVVLVAGRGNTAHVFGDFAPKLTASCHVYGVTRRGYGASSHPASGYDDQRLADDVFAVLDSLKLTAPVLVGHSLAGGELTTMGNQHSSRLAGLVYLDALGDPKDFPLVTDRDRDLQLVRQLLEVDLPRAQPGPVAPPAVGTDQQPAGARVRAAPIEPHHRRILSTANSAVSCVTPTLTTARSCAIS
jgi:pimeloyl-ACP methyl ester carboxylesterase